MADYSDAPYQNSPVVHDKVRDMAQSRVDGSERTVVMRCTGEVSNQVVCIVRFLKQRRCPLWAPVTPATTDEDNGADDLTWLASSQASTILWSGQRGDDQPTGAEQLVGGCGATPVMGGRGDEPDTRQ